MTDMDARTADEVSDLLVDVARRVVLPRFGTLRDDQVLQKRPGDLVTVADREAEAEISAALRLLSPSALVVGEEESFLDPSLLDKLAVADEAWVVDPIDGTRNFTRHSPDFALMVAHVRGGETVEGWIYQPIHDAMYRAELGAGVLCNGEPVARHADRPRLLGAAYTRQSGQPEHIDLRRSWGACGIDYPKLLTGEIDFLAYREGLPWDHLPGCLMVTQMGGRAATRDGVPYAPGVASAPLSVIPADEWDIVLGDVTMV